jgi:hypothetical protein
MLDIVLYVLLFAVLAGSGFVGYVFLTGQLSGFGGGSSLFGPKPERRLDVVEQMSLDARRRLVLIRRDDVEHLIMTGGPVDVVIETGIGDAAPAPVVSKPVAPASPAGGADLGHRPGDARRAPSIDLDRAGKAGSSVL